jgi:hypothetical protein
MKIREQFNELEILEDTISKIKKDCQPFLKEIKSVGRLLYRGSKIQIKSYKILKSYLEDRTPKNMNIEVHDYLNKQFKKKFGWPIRNGIFVSFDPDMAASYGTPYFFFPIGKYKYSFSKKVVDLYEDYYNDLKLLDLSLLGLKLKLGPEHERKYGSKTKKGTWLYKGKGKNLFIKGNIHISDAINKFAEKLKDEIEYDDILKDIVWVPNISLDDYAKEYAEKQKEKIYKILDDIVDSYQSKGLGDQKYVEISFNCDKYYLVKHTWRDELMDELL